MGVPLFSEKFLLKQSQQLLQSPTTLIAALDADDWAPLKRHAAANPQLEAALCAQESAARVFELALDPTSAEARALVLESLTRHLSQQARDCVYTTDPQIVARATRFVEERAGGVLTLRIFGPTLDADGTQPPHTSPTNTGPFSARRTAAVPHERQIGLCTTQIGAPPRQSPNLVPSWMGENNPMRHVRISGQQQQQQPLTDYHTIPRAPQPQPRTIPHNRRQATEQWPAPIPTLQIDILPPSFGQFRPGEGQPDEAMMSPSAGVFHAHTLEQPLGIPPPSRRHSPAPVFGSTSLDAQLRDVVRLSAPPAPGSRNTTRRTSADDEALRQAEENVRLARNAVAADNARRYAWPAHWVRPMMDQAAPAPASTATATARGASPVQNLGAGWRDMAMSVTTRALLDTAHLSDAEAMAHFFSPEQRRLAREQQAAREAAMAAFDPNSDTPPPLEYALPHLAGVMVRPGQEGRSDLSAEEMGVRLSAIERARLGVVPPPEPTQGVASRRVRRPEGWAGEGEEVASEEI